jgi:hypothetical protein
VNVEFFQNIGLPVALQGGQDPYDHPITASYPPMQ